MSTVPRRYRSSTSASAHQGPSKALDVMRGLFNSLEATLTSAEGQQADLDMAALAKTLRQIAQHLSQPTPPNPSQDDFQFIQGFQRLLGVLLALSGYYNPQIRTREETELLFDLVNATLSTFAAAFYNNPGNKRSFKYRIEGGGWESLEQALASIGLGGTDTPGWVYRLLFGELLAFSLGDDRFVELFRSTSVARQDDTGEVAATDADGDGYEHISKEEATAPAEGDGAADTNGKDARPPGSGDAVTRQLDEIVTSTTVVRYPEMLRTVVGFWESMPRTSETPTDPSSTLLLDVLARVVSVSVYNLAALQSAGAFSRLVRLAFAPDAVLDALETKKALEVCTALQYLGIGDPSDAQFLLSSPAPGAADFCLQLASKHSAPPSFHFDLSLEGYSAIDLKDLGRPFPPASSSGYTFTAWIRVDQFDASSHTTLFGVYDASQTCFLLIYLEMDTHNLILQTSVTHQKPSVRFKAARFAEDRWYHIALVHRRPKPLQGSKASLYVDGEFVEQMRCNYPLPPPPVDGASETFASFTSSSGKTRPVHAFIGTPKGLSSHLGPGMVRSRWQLASAHLFEDVLSDEFLAVHHGLGPHYQGNFQDSLGSFQTYAASAALGLRNEANGPGQAEKSDITRAIRDKASSVLPESKIALGILPTAIFHEDARYHEYNLLRNLPRASRARLYELARRTEAPIAINASVPYLPDTIMRAHGLASLVGNSVVVSVPAYLDANMWRLGGFTLVALKLIERATGEEDTLRAVEVMFWSIQNSWRNSEAMERDNGYSILSMILRAKLGFAGAVDGMPERLPLAGDQRDRLGLRLLSLILDFVGYNHDRPHESFIINQLAYRILLIDLDVWRRLSPMIQHVYYRQFSTFGVESRHHQFNGRRLQRMRPVKRLLEAFKTELMPVDVLPHFVEAFTSLVRFNFSKEIMRYMAVFITFALHNPSTTSAPRTPRSHSTGSRSSTPAPMRRPQIDVLLGRRSASPSGTRTLTRRQFAVTLLELYSDLLCENEDKSLVLRFAQTVTNRWLLYLLTEDDAEVVVHGCKILARVLVAHGSGYTSKFAGKAGGFVIMAQRLKRWWDIPTLWPICFAILFGFDVADISFTRNFDFFSLLELFAKSKVVYGDALVILTSMLQHGLKDVLRNQADPDSPHPQQGEFGEATLRPRPTVRPRSSSMELSRALESRSLPAGDRNRVAINTGTLQTVTRFLSDLYSRSADFRDFALSSDYTRHLLTALYPAIVSADPVTAEIELHATESPLNFSGGDVVIRPLSSASAGPVVRASRVTTASPAPPGSHRSTPLRKASSFILLTPQEPPVGPSTAKLKAAVETKSTWAFQNVKGDILEGFLELIIAVFVDQVIARKEFPGFGLFLKVPPGFQEHQAYFESYILRNTISHLETTVRLDPNVICEPKVLTNMGRFHAHITEAIFEGWFMGGAEAMMDFAGTVLEYLQRPEIAVLKSVRLCSQAVKTIRICFLKVVLLRLSDLDQEGIVNTEVTELMNKMLYWQMALLGGLTNEDDYLKLLCYQLYTKLVDKRSFVRCAAAHLFRILLVQKPDESSALLKQCAPPDQGQLVRNFNKLTELDDDTFVQWVDLNRSGLDAVFFGGMSKTWQEFVTVENQRTRNASTSRLEKRREKLRLWHNERLQAEHAIFRHEISNASWAKLIHVSEQNKHQRLVQDQQDDIGFMAATYAKMQLDLHRPGAVFGESRPAKWKLDRTEGRNRMRLRLLPDFTNSHEEYQPKRKSGDSVPASVLRANAAAQARGSSQPPPPVAPKPSLTVTDSTKTESFADVASDAVSQAGVEAEEDFEIVQDADANEGEDSFEDKNRKILRQLQRGDAVQAAYNVSRIIGLEACEGICIIGKEALYIMDNVFQCSTNEIVNVWDAPREERDFFSLMVTDVKTSERRQNSGRKEQESRSWKWHDVISLSKRQFLHRDVAVEVFFTDGRSYLLAAMSQAVRDELFAKLLGKAPHTSAASSLPNPEDAWRLEVVKTTDEAGPGLGRLGSIFASSSSWNPVLKRWQKGEISNFHYLMMVNTMAGRTFNDLTQYPVFPWVLADYASEELDLKNPASFRDLTKPMGAQTAGRVAGYRENYKALQEGGDHPFHYGTHYSSSMIVASYLIRLPPFVQSYIILQGGTFDHADRLFQSIPAAWKSASQDTTTDVRELIPEFFCLPEFLTNINGYNFGTRQSDGARVDNVELPPWAKGDPKIFIAKHREALESPLVSQNLHHWIDLVFGHKQQGDEAVENLNVFYHLSYRSSTNLDSITDPKERAVAAGVIHNFGQTPHQVFTKPHPQRESMRCPIRRLDTAVSALGPLRNPLLEGSERVSALTYAPKLDRLLCAVPFRVNFSPYDKYLEWGYADNSVRFFFYDNRKPAGLFEGFHTGQVACVIFADFKTLITAGEDCVIAVHAVQTSLGKPVDVGLKSSLFGHKTPVRMMAVSKAFSTLVSVAEDGQGFLWDINRLKFIRKLPLTRPVQCARINDVTGEIMLCSGPNVVLYTLNGALLLDQNVCSDEDDHVHSCAFYEGAGNEWLENFLVFTGHRRGRVNVWRRMILASGKWTLELVTRLDHVDPKSVSGANHPAGITCITPLPQCVYTGDDDGRVFEWNLHQRDR